MKKQIVAIDIDDVVAQATEALRLDVNTRFNIEISQEAYREPHDYWGYYESVWQKHEAVKDMSYDSYYIELRESQSHIPLLPGAEFAIMKLAKKYKIVFITARDETLKTATIEWLTQNLPQLEYDIYFTNHLVEENRLTKGEVCKQVGAQYLLDDNIDHCRSALENDVQAVLFGDYGWHRSLKADELPRCKDWQAVLEYFDAA